MLYTDARRALFAFAAVAWRKSPDTRQTPHIRSIFYKRYFVTMRTFRWKVLYRCRACGRR